MSTTVLGTIDVGGEGKAVLLAALNQALGKNFTLAEFTFSDPTPVTIPTPTRNTVIKLAPFAASGYYGVRKVYYNRIHVTELGPISVVRGAATRVSDLLPAINEKYGIFVQPTDIFDSVLPAEIPGEPEVLINFNFRPTSIIFYGETRIILGSNDPAAGGGGGGGTVAPFAGETMLFMTEAHRRPSEVGFPDSYVIDAFSTFIDADKTRKRFGSVSDETGAMSFEKLFKRSYDASSYDSAQNKHIIVYSWRNAVNDVFAINIYGEVLKAALSGLSWEFVSNVLELDLTVESIVSYAQVYRPVLTAGRLPTGEVFVVGLMAGAVVLRKTTDDGATWTNEHTFGVTDNHGYSSTSIMGGYVTYLDSMVHGGKLWTIVQSGLDYATKPGSGASGPAVESLDLTTFALDYHTLGELTAQNTTQPFAISASDNNYCLVTPESDLVATPNVAGLVRLGNSICYTAVMYVFDSSYKAQVVGNVQLSRELVDDTNRFISAYSITLQKDNDLSLDVIEIGCRVPSAVVPYEAYALGMRERTQDGFVTYGVKVYTSVREGAARNAWVESNITLGDGNPHKKVVIETKSKRMHFIAQPENALARIRFTEDNAIAGFRATVDSSITLDKHGGFATLTGFGSGIYSNPTVLETLNTSYGLLPYSNTEATKTDINFSFVARDQQGGYKWLVSDVTNSPLQERQFGGEYAFIGKTPVLTFANGADIFAWSELSNGIFKSANGGKAWEMVAESQVYYNQTQSDKPDRNILGSAQIKTRPEQFKAAAVVDDDFIIDMQFNEPVKLVDRIDNNFEKAVTLQDRVLFRASALNVGDRGYNFQDELGGYGVNFFGQYAPKKVLTWEADSVGNVVTGVGTYTSDNTQPYGQLYGRSNYSSYISNAFVILDLNTKVKFLDIEQLVYGYEDVSGTDVYSLKIVRAGGIVNEVQLFGGANPSLTTFKPQVAYALWEFQETNYVPYIYYDDKKILLIGRLKEDGLFDTTLHLINVPSDNGAPLEIVPVFNANRREYYYAQRGNGIFKMGYTYNTVTKTSVLSLTRIFTLNGVVADLNIVSGAVRLAAPISEPTVPLIPTFPANGTLLNTFCDGTTKTGVYADGSGGTYNQIVETNSTDCGYQAPAPTPVGANSATMTINTTTATADLIETAVVAQEDGTAYAVYELSAGLNANTNVVLSFIGASADLSDVQAVHYRIGTGSFETVTFPQTITIPAGQTELVVRITYVQDGGTEGDELFTLRLAKSAGNTQITNTDPIDTVFTVQDSVTAARWAVNADAEYLDDFENANKSWSGTFSSLYNSPQATPTSATYIAQDKVLRVVQPDPDTLNRGFVWLYPNGSHFYSRARFTVDLSIPKLGIIDDNTGDKSEINWDAPLPADHSYRESIVNLCVMDNDVNTFGNTIRIVFAYEGGLTQDLRAGTAPNKTTVPSSTVDTHLGTVPINIPRGGEIRIVGEAYNEGGSKKLDVYVNGVLLHTYTLSYFTDSSVVTMAAELSGLSAATVDVRRVMVEDAFVPELTPTTWSPAKSSPNGTFSNGNQTTATPDKSATAYAASSGKYYVEFSGIANYVGVSEDSESEMTPPGVGPYSVGYSRTDGIIYVNGEPVGTPIATEPTIVRMLLDVDNKLVSFYTDGSTTPAVVPLQGDIFHIGCGGYGTCTLNAGASPFAYAVPEGYTPGFGEDLNPANNTSAFVATRMSTVDKAANVTLDSTGLEVSLGHFSGSVRSKFGIDSGKWAWEVKPTLNEQHAMIGVSTADALVNGGSGNAFPGIHSASWGYYGLTGQIYNSDAGAAYGQALQAGDVLTVLLDMDNGTLSYMINGVDQGVAATGLTGTYYAHVGNASSASTAMTINFGSKPFDYPVPAGYTKGFGVEDIVPTKYNSVIPKTLGNFASVSNGGDFVTFTGYTFSTVMSQGTVYFGKWAWEVYPQHDALALRIGICVPEITAQQVLGTPLAEGYGYQGELGDLNSNAYGASFTEGDVITVLLDMDAGTLSFMKNGVDQGVAATGLTGEWRAAVCKTANDFYPRVDTNFGDRSFKYPVPAGYTKGFGNTR